MGSVKTFTGRGSRLQAGPSSVIPGCSSPGQDGSTTSGACAYSEAVAVLSPIAGALHIVHGPRGCASYTRSLTEFSSGGYDTYKAECKDCFCTDIGELDVIFGGEKKLTSAIRELVAAHKPAAVFIYPTCLVEVIGDDLEAVCRSAARELKVPVLPVVSPGRGGAESACQALLKLMGTRRHRAKSPYAVNILGDDNTPGDLWPIRSCLEALGIEVISTLTGDSSVEEIRRSHLAGLNLVQRSETMTSLASKMEDTYGIPSRRVDFLGIEMISSAIIAAAEFFDDSCLICEAEKLISQESRRIRRQLERYRSRLKGTRAAISTKGASKAFSLIKASQDLGMEMVVVGCHSGDWVERQMVSNATGCEMVALGEMATTDLAALLAGKAVNILIGGREEQFMAHKLGIPFCNVGRGRTATFEGFDGMVNFARAVDATANSPVWKLALSRPRANPIASSPTANTDCI
ncbi:MAG TPA: nitrogenase component 1 [Methanotrichaceae archaeon]|nr:nitrogenase component 1 [Methanotrichaceae archaeon]